MPGQVPWGVPSLNRFPSCICPTGSPVNRHEAASPGVIRVHNKIEKLRWTVDPESQVQ